MEQQQQKMETELNHQHMLRSFQKIKGTQRLVCNGTIDLNLYSMIIGVCVWFSPLASRFILNSSID